MHNSPNTRPSPLTDYKFDEQFSKAYTQTVSTKTDRGILKGHGEFGDVLHGCEATAKAVEAHRRSPDDRKKIADVNKASTHLEKVAEKYLEKREGRTDRDGIAQLKISTTENALVGARTVQAQLTLGNQQLGQLNQIHAQINGANDLETQRQHVDAFREREAHAFSRQKGGNQQADSGTSDVRIVKGPDDRIAFVFKSVEGESPSMGTQPGAGAVRELLASRVCEAMKETGGPDFGWAHTSIGTLDGKLGALVDGINGEKVLDKDGCSALAKKYDAQEINVKRGESERLFEQVSPQEIQKAALCNIAMAQFDIKWDNVFVQKAGTQEHPEHTTRPYDGGAAFPDKDTFMAQALFKGVGPASAEGLCYLEYRDGELKQHPQTAAAPLDPKLRAEFANIDVNRVTGAMNRALDEAQHQGIAPAEVEKARSGCEMVAESLGRMQTAVAHLGPQATLKDCIDACQAQHQEVVNAHKDGWLNEKVEQFEGMQKDPKFQGLLPALDKFDHVKVEVDGKPQVQLTEKGKLELCENFMQPNQRATLHQLADIGAEKLRADFPKQVPLQAGNKPTSLMANYNTAHPPAQQQAHHL
jgi:hypothetical protein